MIRNDGTAIAYNKTLDIRYNLVKNWEILVLFLIKFNKEK
jgi:hypothetical protein